METVENNCHGTPTVSWDAGKLKQLLTAELHISSLWAETDLINDGPCKDICVHEYHLMRLHLRTRIIL